MDLYLFEPDGRSPGRDLIYNESGEIVLHLTVAGIRSMAEANRAERHAWAERYAVAARSPEAHKYLGFRVIKAEPCPGLLGAVLISCLN